MTHSFAPRSRKVRVLATLGPASNTPEMIAKLFQAGADAFRINMSHGDQASKVDVIKAIRALEQEFDRPSTILADLQGPKIRLGRFTEGATVWATGETVRITVDDVEAGGTGHRHRDLHHQPRIEGLGNDVLGAEAQLLAAVGAGDDVAGLGLGELAAELAEPRPQCGHVGGALPLLVPRLAVAGGVGEALSA